MTEQVLPLSEAAAFEPTPNPAPKSLRVYPKEQTLFIIMALISGLAWVALTMATVGVIWLIMLVLYVFGLFGFSYLIAHVRGNGVHVTAEQFPDLHARFVHCADIIGLKKHPEFYLITGNGALNAFATRFLHRYYVILLSDIVDALQDDPEALNFYIGHELGHIAQKHLVHHWWLVFSRWIPLLGPAYSRAREYSCDQYGLMCTKDAKSAVHALAVLAAGGSRWKSMNHQAYIKQAQHTGGFWMSLNELTGDYPWLCKRVARVENNVDAKFPRRSFFAWLISALIPNTGFGVLGAMIIYMYILLLAVPIGIASYTQYQKKAQSAQAKVVLGQAHADLTRATAILTAKYDNGEELGELTTESLGYQSKDALIKDVKYHAESAAIVATLAAPYEASTITLHPALNEEADTPSLIWSCTVSGSFDIAAMPAGCDLDEAPGDAAKADSSLSSLFKLLK